MRSSPNRFSALTRRCGSLVTVGNHRDGGPTWDGALGFQFISAEAAHAWVHAYYNAYTKRMEKLTDYATNANIALVTYFMCAETDEEARRRADGVPFSIRNFYGAAGQNRAPSARTVDLWSEYEKWKAENPEGHARALRGGLSAHLRQFAVS